MIVASAKPTARNRPWRSESLESIHRIPDMTVAVSKKRWRQRRPCFVQLVPPLDEVLQFARKEATWARLPCGGGQLDYVPAFYQSVQKFHIGGPLLRCRHLLPDSRR